MNNIDFKKIDHVVVKTCKVHKDGEFISVDASRFIHSELPGWSLMSVRCLRGGKFYFNVTASMVGDISENDINEFAEILQIVEARPHIELVKDEDNLEEVRYKRTPIPINTIPEEIERLLTPEEPVTPHCVKEVRE